MHRQSPRVWLPALLLPLAAQAENASYQAEPLVVTGSRYQASSWRLPFSINRIDAEQATLGKPGVNLSEVLGSVPGLAVQNRQNYAQDLQVSSRGFGARSAFGIRGIKLLADGVPLSNPDGQGQAATFDLDSLERIEVLRGPFASVYGSNSGGVIQLFSRDGEGAPRVSLDTSQAAFGTSRTRVAVEGGNDQAGFILNRSHFETDGYRDHSGAILDKTFAKLTLYPDDASKLSLSFSQLDQNDTQDPQGLTWQQVQDDRRAAAPSALAFDTRKTVDHQQLALNYERSFAAGTWQSTVYSGTRRVIQYQSIPVAVQANPSHSGGVIDFKRRFHGIGNRWIQPFDLGASLLTLTAGLDYDQSRDDRQGYENFVGSTLGVKGNLRRDERNEVSSLSPYLQAAWQLGKLDLQAGLRHNQVKFEVDDRFLSNGDDSGSVTYRELTPTLGASYALLPELNLYASWGKGLETPTLNELSYSGAGGGFGFDLQPATSKQLEIGLKARLAEATSLQLALFQIDTDDELVVASASGGRTRFQNAAQTRRRGVELAMESQLSETLRATLAYTRIDATYRQDFTSGGRLIEAGNRLPGIPASTLYGELAWQPREGFSTALEGLYRSKLYVEDSNAAKAAPSYALFNWQARFEQTLGALTFNQVLRIDNLLDREYIGSVIVGESNGRYYEPGPERAWYVGAGVQYRFD
ncbi:TonB-dependent receptor family protein [Ectopseudomonas hydrolytica]|uniref:TonB-dependent receptor family protein n=1 Tax=Ectopseudomonas hydrolytica TaxID=2493633 RepID=UPI0018A7107B|nr:TonB-dependent receptor [Pseudomonas hydrolytica]MBF8160630.1 TonB-dependent receptor [Pseudomonas mendocina]UTH33640.1 TonB-dependent receptor [Pseudomonas hydrolytica]UZZ12910.1 TonB-dependent receptor [Pseudomonas mendocina]